MRSPLSFTGGGEEVAVGEQKEWALSQKLRVCAASVRSPVLKKSSTAKARLMSVTRASTLIVGVTQSVIGHAGFLDSGWWVVDRKGLVLSHPFAKEGKRMRHPVL